MKKYVFLFKIDEISMIDSEYLIDLFLFDIRSEIKILFQSHNYRTYN